MGDVAEAQTGPELRAALTAGWRPEPHPALIALGYNEQAYASVAVEVLQFGGGDPAAFLGQPADDVAPRWVAIDQGIVHLTSHRFAFQLGRQFANVPYTSIADAHCDADGLCIWQHVRAPLKLLLAEPEWHFVLFRWLAYSDPR